MHGTKGIAEPKDTTCKPSLIVNLFLLFPQCPDLGQYRLGLNLESDTVQPIHEPLPKTCWSEDSTSTKVDIIL